MSRWRSSRHLPRFVWLAGAAVFAVVPKCLLCVAGYLGLATAVGLGGSELCGGPHGGNVVAPAMLALGVVVSIGAAIWAWLRASLANPERPRTATFPGHGLAATKKGRAYEYARPMEDRGHVARERATTGT